MRTYASKFLIGTLAGLVAALMACSAVLVWRLSQGPIVLDFLSPYLESALNQNRAGVHVSLGRTVLDWSDLSANFPVTVEQVRISDPLGREVATVPRLAVTLSARALLRGMIAPKRIELIRPTLNLVRRPDGSLGIGPETGEDATSFQDVLRRLLTSFGGPYEPDRALGRLDTLTIADIDLTVTDQAAKMIWRLPHSRLVLSRTERGFSGDLALPLRVQGRTWRFSFSGAYDRAAEHGLGRLDFAGVNPSLLPTGDPSLDPLRGVNMTVGGNVALEYRLSGNRLALRAALSSGSGTFNLAQLYAEPLRLDHVDLRASYDGAARRAQIESFRIQRDAVSIDLQGKLDFGPSGWRPAIGAQGSAKDVSLDALMTLWPVKVAPGGRHWAAENMKTAHIPTATFRLDLPKEAWSGAPVPPEAIDLTFRIEKAVAHYLGSLPPLTEARGTATVRGNELRIAIEQAAVQVPDAGRLNLSDGKVAIGPLNQHDMFADITFAAAGSGRAVLGLLDQEPLGYARDFGLSPASVEGDAEGQVHLHMPTKKDLRLREIDFNAAFRLSHFGLPDLIAGVPLKDGKMTLDVTRQAIDGKGEGRLAGSPAILTWRHELGSGIAVPTHFGVRTRLTDEARREIGVGLEPYLSGPVDLDATINGNGTRISAGTVSIDLAPADLELEPLAWSKPAGKPATASASFRRTGEQLAIERFEARAPDLEAKGTAALNADGGLERLTLDPFRVGQGADLSATLRRSGEISELRIQGKSLDASSFIKRLREKGRKSSLPPFQLHAHLGRLRLAANSELKDVAGRGAGDGKRITELDFRGAISDKAKVTLRIAPARDGVRRLDLKSEDGGFLLAALGLTQNVTGGTLDLGADLLPPNQGDATRGQVRLERFKIVKAPPLAKVLTVASLTGLRDILVGQGMTFQRLDLPFEIRSDTIHLNEGRAVGSSLGITVHGTIDRKNDVLDLDGTLAPIYTINSLLGHVPVLGKLLLRGKEGVIALRYSVKGPVADPQVSANPLSVLTPGFLRGIFDLMDRPSQGPGYPAPQAAPAPAPPAADASSVAAPR